MPAKAILKHSCTLLLIIIAFLHKANAQLTANFTGSPTSGCTPLVVNFTDASTGNPNQWKWDLGNGTISYLQNPSGTYFTPGTYNVKLVVQNAAGNADSVIKSQYITVYALPTVNFAATPQTGCAPLQVQFTDQSNAGSGTLTSWLWDFGDGNTATTQHPAHTYAFPGNYNVTLQVVNSFGCSKTLTKTQFISVGSSIHADFTNTQPTSCQPPATINFTNLSTGSGTLNYQWNFGDGGTSILANPAHTYVTNGSFTVTLIVTSSSGCTDTLVKQSAVVINSLSASFTSANNICKDAPLQFTNTTIPTPASVLWSFGDGTTSTVLSPAKTYTAPGIYNVKMVAVLGTCIDSAFKIIIVNDKPSVAFSAPFTTSCKPPFTANFVNTSIGGSTYFWDFGDGGTSTLQNPSHTYTAYGQFTVKLVVTSISGCSDSLTIPNYIKIEAPQASINGLPASGCAPLTHLFSATVNSNDPVVSYQWDFGDGSTSILPNPVHTFPAGTYDITLIITTAGGCTDTVVVPNGIVSSVKPQANFGANPRNTCAKQSIQFTDSSTGNITNWFWQFGDGGTSSDPNPLYKYNDTGYFDVTLIIWNNGCSDTITFVDYIYINPPIAAFASLNSCSNKKTVNFTDQSVGPDEWHWSFGTGDTSNLQHPSYTFPDTGYYVITLRVVNHTTGCDDITTHVIRIVDEKAIFTATDTVLCKNNSTTFNAVEKSPNAIVSYSWDFGDGYTGTGKSISHVYVNSGWYTVTLVITDIYGCKDTLTRLNYIRVNGPTSAFTIPGTGTCLLSAVTFTDNSADDGLHPITTWIWNYGDGTSDTLTAPPFVHTYANPGTYTVTLKTIDTEGCSDITNNNSTIVISKPVADFYTPDSVVCPNITINFVSTSTGPGLQYFWDFGDGTGSTQANPSHFYSTEGDYSVKLRIVDQYGCTDSVFKPNYIHIREPHALFTVSDSMTTCPPLIVTFTNQSTNDITKHWDFGDGSSANAGNPVHIYNTPGTYIAKLIVTGPGGMCTDTFFKTIVVRGPIGTFTYGPLNGCSPLTVNLNAHTPDRLSFIWDYNDGNVYSTPDSVVSHIYTLPGSYLPKMILVDSSGCQVPIPGPDTIRVTGVHALFGVSQQSFCDSTIAFFSDSSYSNDGFTSWFWDFGDGNTSTLQNPSHKYAAPGQYFPKLVVVTLNGCRDTAMLSVPVRIVSSPVADFSNSPNGCSPLSVMFNGMLTVPDTLAISWSWNFGNGNVSSLQNPPAQVYTNPQVYNIQLIATNSMGCKDTVNKTVEAYPIPVVDAGPAAQICLGSNTTLNATGAATYTWSPSAGLSCTSCPNPVASPPTNKTYYVTGSSIHGCVNNDSVNINVIQPFVMQHDPGDTLCVGGSTRLFASGANSYLWSPAAGLNSTTSPTPLASPKTTTTYMVVGSDAYGCFTDTGYATIKVYPKPTVFAGNDTTIKNGQKAILVPSISSDVNWYYWMPDPSIVTRMGRNVTVAPKQTTEYTIEVRNPGGCKALDKVTVYVLCDGDNIFIPNTFSPNGDGMNDRFYPRGSGLFSIKTFRVFDRWGEIVFENNNFKPNDANSGWDGTFRGKELTSDVYVYTIEIVCDNSTVMTLKGNIALLR